MTRALSPQEVCRATSQEQREGTSRRGDGGSPNRHRRNEQEIQNQGNEKGGQLHDQDPDVEVSRIESIAGKVPHAAEGSGDQENEKDVQVFPIDRLSYERKGRENGRSDEQRETHGTEQRELRHRCELSTKRVR